MKIVKTASGKNKIKMSRSEWLELGGKSGWLKQAQFQTTKPAPTTAQQGQQKGQLGQNQEGLTDGGMEGFKTEDAEMAEAVQRGYDKNLDEVDPTALGIAEGLEETPGNVCGNSALGPIYCGASLGVDRAMMPQLADKPKLYQELRDGKLTGSPVKVEEGVTRNVTDLKPSQANIKGGKIRGMIGPSEGVAWNIGDAVGGDWIWTIPKQKNIAVSQDGYVIDGHHTWAAALAKDYLENGLEDNPSTGPEGLQMPVTVVHLPIGEALIAMSKSGTTSYKDLDDNPVDKPNPEQIKALVNQKIQEKAQKDQKAKQQQAQQPRAANTENCGIKAFASNNSIVLSEQAGWINKKAGWEDEQKQKGQGADDYFGGISGGVSIGANKSQQGMAQKILNGEPAESVLEGIGPITKKLVMDIVNQQQAPAQQAPAQQAPAQQAPAQQAQYTTQQIVDWGKQSGNPKLQQTIGRITSQGNPSDVQKLNDAVGGDKEAQKWLLGIAAGF